MTLRELYHLARSRLSAAGVDAPAYDAAALVQLVFGVDRSALLVHGVPAPSEITRVLAGAGLYLEELRRVTPDLESAFLALTGQPAGPDTSTEESTS